MFTVKTLVAPAAKSAFTGLVKVGAWLMFRMKSWEAPDPIPLAAARETW